MQKKTRLFFDETVDEFLPESWPSHSQWYRRPQLQGWSFSPSKSSQKFAFSLSFYFRLADFSIAFTLGGLLNCMSFLEENRHFLKAPFLLKTLFLTAAGIRFLSGKCMATNLTSNFTSWSKIKKFLQISHDESGFGESTVISKTWFGKSALTDETGSSYALLMWC